MAELGFYVKEGGRGSYLRKIAKLRALRAGDGVLVFVVEGSDRAAFLWMLLIRKQ